MHVFFKIQFKKTTFTCRQDGLHWKTEGKGESHTGRACGERGVSGGQAAQAGGRGGAGQLGCTADKVRSRCTGVGQ